MTPLHTACCQGESDIARQLILAGSDVTCLDDELSTPLHEAATVGDTKIARVILDSCKIGDKPDTEKLVSGVYHEFKTNITAVINTINSKQLISSD